MIFYCPEILQNAIFSKGDIVMETTWMTREQAAEWLGVSTRTITNIVKEMVRAGCDGIWQEPGFLRINKLDMSNYLRKRRK